MINAEKGQGSPNSYFFHITFHKDDGKWYALEVNSARREAFDTKEAAMDQVREWVEDMGISGFSHVSIHDEHGKIRSTESL